MHPPPRLFGRTGELEILGQLIANARRGRSAVLVVRGEPGIGKTELLRQLCAPMLGRLGSLAEPQRRALSVAFELASGDSPDRFMVGLAALSLMARTTRHPEGRPAR